MRRQRAVLSRERLAALLLALAALVAVLATGAFAHPLKTQTLRVTPMPGGVVVSSDGRIRCGTRCVANYRSGTMVTLAARANQYFDFNQWRGACIGAVPSCPLEIDRSTSVGAKYVREQTDLSVTVGGNGVVLSDPAGLRCGPVTNAVCQASFPKDLPITLSVQPTPFDSVFAGWGGACSAAIGTSCVITPTSPSEISAAFTLNSGQVGSRTLSLSLSGPAITSSPPGIACGSRCSASFPVNTYVTLSGDTGYHWAKACRGFGTTCLVVVDQDTSIEAFVTYAASNGVGLNVTVSGPGSVTGGSKIRCGRAARTLYDCQEIFSSRGRVSLHAHPQAHGRLVRWTGFCRGHGRCVVVTDAPKSVGAVFAHG